MKKNFFLITVNFLLSCSKDAVIPQNKPEAAPHFFSCQDTSSVSFSLDIFPLLQNNCSNCHSTPGSGGVNLDSYSSIKQMILSGQLMPVVTNTDTNSTIMPPPPLRHLDSCEIKSLNLWIAKGCLNN